MSVTGPPGWTLFSLKGIPFYLQLLGRQLERTDVEPVNKEVIERVFKETLTE